MIRWSWVLVCGCGMSEEEFRQAYIEKSCAASIDCAGEASAVVTFGSQEDCELFLGGLLGAAVSTCDYDPSAAKGCLSDIESAECDAVNSGDLAGDCTAVYTGECGWGTTE